MINNAVDRVALRNALYDADAITMHGIEIINTFDSPVNNSNWINVKDRLPDDYVPVLTCDCKGNIHIMSHCQMYDAPFGIDRFNKRYFMVRWWQPLPQKPEND